MFEILRIFFFFFFIEDDLVWVGSFLLWKYNKILESFHVFGWYRFNFPLGVFLLLSLFPWKFADIAFLENSLFLASCLAPCIIALLSCWIIKAFLDGSSINELASVPTDTVTPIRATTAQPFDLFFSISSRSIVEPFTRGWFRPLPSRMEDSILLAFFQFLVIRQAGRETHGIRVSKHSNALERIGRSRGAQPIDFFMRFSPTCNMQFLYPTASKRVERSFDFSLRRSLSFH